MLVFKGLVALFVVTLLVLPFLRGLWVVVGGVVAWLALTIAPWERFWRRQLREGRSLRGAGSRPAAAGAIVAAGAAICIASDYWFGTHGLDQFGNQVVGAQWDLVIAAPFALLAGLTLLFAMSIVGAVVTAALLAAVCVLSYWAVDTSTSSTAAIGLFYPWLLGLPLIVIGYVVDAAARGVVAWRRTSG